MDADVEAAKDRAARDIAAIKARVEQAKAQISAGAEEVPIGQGWTIQQLGLEYPLVDAQGRLWRQVGNKLVRIGHAAGRIG